MNLDNNNGKVYCNIIKSKNIIIHIKNIFTIHRNFTDYSLK